jgi:multiple sugar transport system permease protein
VTRPAKLLKALATPRLRGVASASPHSKKNKIAYLIILPTVFLSSIFVVFPIVQTLWISFTNQVLAGGQAHKTHFVGLKNYSGLAHDSHFLNSFRLTLFYALLNIICSVGAGLVTALIVNKKFKGRGVVRGILTMPWAFPDVASAIIFVWILNAAFGVIGYFNQWLPFNTQGGWLTSSPLAFISVVVMSMWKTFPFYSIVFLSALQGVPEDLVEAATVDGASWFQRFKTVVFPAIRPTFILLCVLAFIFAFRQFSMIYLTTGGGPDESTQTLTISVFLSAFKFFDSALASATGVFGLIVTAGVAVIFLYFQDKQDKEV